jgi:predicted regulator of Ras-like GTPase activity (Roadblock/LC7/MglB family)
METLKAINVHLQEFSGIEGFKAAAVFTARGEMIEAKAVGGYDINSVGIFANKTLLTAQQAADHEDVGPVNLVQIRTGKVTIFAHCFNRAADTAPTKKGEAHFHTILVLGPEGNVGMAILILDKIAGEIADELA